MFPVDVCGNSIAEIPTTERFEMSLSWPIDVTVLWSRMDLAISEQVKIVGHRFQSVDLRPGESAKSVRSGA